MNILVVDATDTGRGRAMVLAFCQDDHAAHLATSRTDVHQAPDWERGIRLPDRIDLLIHHARDTEQRIAESLLEGQVQPVTIRYSGGAQPSNGDRLTIYRAIDGANVVLTPDEAVELCAWVGRGARDGETPSLLKRPEWPESLVGVYLGLIAHDRGVNVLGDLPHEAWTRAEAELQDLLTKRPDLVGVAWDGFDLETPVNNAAKLDRLVELMTCPATEPEAIVMFAPWSIDCEGVRLQKLVKHELVDKIIDKTAKQAMRGCDRPEGWRDLKHEYPFRLKQARKLAEDLLDLYTPIGLVDQCGVFAQCSEQILRGVKQTVQAACFRESGIAGLQEPLRIAVDDLTNAVDRFGELAQADQRADDLICIENWHVVQQRAEDLKKVLIQMPQGIVFP